MIEVLGYCWWESGGALYRDQLRSGQLTKCHANGVIFYVRENVNGRDSFFVSSNERLGMKGGDDGKSGPALRHQILELCCQPEYFQEIADLVRLADHLRRPVLSNRMFTVAWAEKQLRDYERAKVA